MQKLLLHACCAPCSSGVVPQLVSENKYDITLLFYNPNIDTAIEFEKRLQTLKDYVEKYNLENETNIKLVSIPYNHEEFLKEIEGLESEIEGGKRCANCIALRLKFAGNYAKKNGYDLFCSTLSVSPHKNHILINEIGNALSKELGINYLENNFKKNDGFLNSIKNSKKYNLYRQNYCGCEFAKSHLK